MSAHVTTRRQPWGAQMRSWLHHGRHTRRAIAANRVHGLQLRHIYR